MVNSMTVLKEVTTCTAQEFHFEAVAPLFFLTFLYSWSRKRLKGDLRKLCSVAAPQPNCYPHFP
jgi:uncharacterized membrane protein